MVADLKIGVLFNLRRRQLPGLFLVGLGADAVHGKSVERKVCEVVILADRMLVYMRNFVLLTWLKLVNLRVRYMLIMVTVELVTMVT